MTSERKSQVWLEDQIKTLMELTQQAEERFCETGQAGGRRPVHEGKTMS